MNASSLTVTTQQQSYPWGSNEYLPAKTRGRQDSWWAEAAVGCERDPAMGRTSRRTAEVAMQFGLPACGSRTTIVNHATIPLAAGQLVAVVGPSGSGKSTILQQIESQFAGAANVARVPFPATAAILDRVAVGQPLCEALAILTSCALGEPRLWLRRFEGLSEGEQFRARLARAIGLQQGRATGPLICDEFGAFLHRRAAKAVSHGVRKLVTRLGLCVVTACCREDDLDDLQPDVLVKTSSGGRCVVTTATPVASPIFSLRRKMRIEPGRKRDYEHFAAMHYRSSEELGFVDKVFILREGQGGEPLGIVVYAYPPLELALRNQATDKRFSRNTKELNRCVRILRRLVIHPDVRGCGLGHDLVCKTLPLVGTEYVECLANMGRVNPVFEKAGMTCIGQCDVHPSRKRALAELQAMGVDPAARSFSVHVARKRRVREIVSSVVAEWYRATTGGGDARVGRQSPALMAQTFRGLIASRPVYYLWRNEKLDQTDKPRRRDVSPASRRSPTAQVGGKRRGKVNPRRRRDKRRHHPDGQRR